MAITSLRSIRRNFVLPCVAMAVAFVVVITAGVRPWSAGDDMQAEIFSLMTFTLAAGVITAIAAEFLRGAGVVRTQTGKNLGRRRFCWCDGILDVTVDTSSTLASW